MISRWFFAFAWLACMASGWPVMAAPTPPMDPKQMSGIPRPDPQVPPGSVTVRVLGEGGFSEPLVDVEVALELTSPANVTERRTAKTGAEGRATFEGLEAFAGGQAIAKVDFEGQPAASQPIPLLAEAGSRVMLVRGAASADPHGAPADAGPQPGEVFPLESSPPGTLTVGAFDLQARRGLPGIEVRLVSEGEGTPPSERKATTDAVGKVVFDGLLSSELPEGARWVVEAVLSPGAEPQRSKPFSMPTSSGAALVLAEGRLPAVPQQPKARRSLPGPRVLPSLAAGTVKVTVVGGHDEPVPGQSVVIIKQSAAATDERFEGVTDAGGVATFAEVPLQQDAVYSVTVTYSGAPYRSPLFLMEERGGVAVDLRVFETTSDRSLVRSALQFDLEERENDHVQVIQVYEVFVSGERAFWDPKLEIGAVGGAKGLAVLRPAEPWLQHEDQAPAARLSGPLPPNERINLSIGYLLEHDGAAEVAWSPPFSTVETSVVVDESLALEAPGAEKSDLRAPVEGRAVYVLSPTGLGGTARFEVQGLRVANPVFRTLAAVLAGLMAVALAAGMLLRPRVSAKDRLLQRKQELLSSLETQGSKLTPQARQRAVAALDQVHRQLHALEQLETRA